MPETKNAMQKRHRLELKQFQQKKADDAKKWRGLSQQEVEKKKKEMEQMEKDLLFRHEQELKSITKEEDIEEEPSFEELEKKRREEMEKLQEKATRDREKKKQKEIEKQKVIENETKNSLKEQELESIRKKLVNLKIKPIESDGHCLYRALGDQYNLLYKQNIDYKFIRKQIAQYMRQHEEELSVFLDKDMSWSKYCDQVEFSSEWGGQLEVRAFCEAMHTKVNIVQGFDLPDILMGEEESVITSETAPILQISYHKHYYSLGEHYNSLVPQ